MNQISEFQNEKLNLKIEIEKLQNENEKNSIEKLNLIEEYKNIVFRLNDDNNK